MPTLSLRPATTADGPAMGRIGTRAFRTNMSLAIFPAHLRTSATDDAENAWRAFRTLRRLNEGKDTLVVVDDGEGQEAEEVVGFAQWERPGQASQGLEGHSEAIETPELDGEALATMMGAMDEETRKQLGPEGHGNMWYLIILSVDPDHQRRGVGKKLVRWGLEQAAAEGKEVFLIATHEGKPLYESFGFRVLGEFETVGLVHYSMLWTPDGAN